jgi:hypothetical protein
VQLMLTGSGTMRWASRLMCMRDLKKIVKFVYRVGNFKERALEGDLGIDGTIILIIDPSNFDQKGNAHQFQYNFHVNFNSDFK